MRKLILYFMIITLLISTCRIDAKPQKTYILTTISYLVPIVKAIGGVMVEVECLIPQGADPHYYELTPADINKLEKADIIVLTGPAHLPIETKIEKIIRERGLSKVIVDYRNYTKLGLSLLRLPNGKVNPHGYFLSLRGIRAISKSIAKALAIINPENTSYYNRNLEEYLNKIDNIEKLSKDILGKRKYRVNIITPFLQYLLEDLSIEIVDVLVYELGVSPSVKDVENFINSIKKGRSQMVVMDCREALKYKDLIELFEENNIPYVIIPLTSADLMNNGVEYSAIILATSLSTTFKGGSVETKEDFNGDILLISVTLNLALVVLLSYILLSRERR